jgi:hypothetical protein
MLQVKQDIHMEHTHNCMFYNWAFGTYWHYRYDFITGCCMFRVLVTVIHCVFDRWTLWFIGRSILISWVFQFVILIRLRQDCQIYSCRNSVTLCGPHIGNKIGNRSAEIASGRLLSNLYVGLLTARDVSLSFHIWCSDGGENVDCGHLDCDAL